MANRRQRSSKSKWLIVVIAIIAVAVIGFILYKHWNKANNPNLAISQSGKQTVTGTTSTPTQHQLPSNGNLTHSGGVIDKQGQTTATLPPSSEWTNSASGNITLQTPTANSVVKSGDSLVGLAKVGSVQFILSDSSVGLIAQGNLKVVNGKFSGVLQFTPHSNSGKLEVYYPNPNNGAEEDIIDINVSFNP